jgi:tetratricopeptide (TPR) repeat protein
MFEWLFKTEKKLPTESSAPEPSRSPGAKTEDHTHARSRTTHLGLQHHQAGRLSEAEAAYREVLAVDRDNVDALHFLGVIAYQRGQHEQAAELISQALARNASNAPAHNNLGNVFRAQDKLDKALACFQRALALQPDYADAHVNLGAVFRAQDRLEEAVACHRKALALKPVLPEAHFNLGNALSALGRLQEAEASYGQALRLRPDAARIKFAHALLKLLQGDYESGFPLYEIRFEENALPDLYAAMYDRAAKLQGAPRWQGEDLASRALLVWTDQGFGDSLMMMRYLPLLKDRGVGRLIVYCEPQLVRLVKTIPGVDDVVPATHPVPFGEFELQCPIMSLPLLFHARVETIPRDVPYLFVPNQLRQEWAQKLSGIAPLKVGLVWAGGDLNSKNALRSVQLGQFSPWFGIPNVTFVSLQKGEQANQLEEAGLQVLDWMDECNDLLDTAALIEQLELVISVDTAVAHLAGALGKPIWMLNRFESEWRWMLEREDSPWYPTMKIFRQSKPGDWGDVIVRVASALTLHSISGR